MTATTLGLAALFVYGLGLTLQGLGLSLGRYMISSNPGVQNRPSEIGTYHPVSIWVADRLDAKRAKSRKPRA